MDAAEPTSTCGEGKKAVAWLPAHRTRTSMSQEPWRQPCNPCRVHSKYQRTHRGAGSPPNRSWLSTRCRVHSKVPENPPVVRAAHPNRSWLSTRIDTIGNLEKAARISKIDLKVSRPPSKATPPKHANSAIVQPSLGKTPVRPNECRGKCVQVAG
ncbi:unnamed protein product [Boreogadus saida]